MGKKKVTTEDHNQSRLSEIFQRAMELFIERGYDNTPMSLVARETGFSKAGIYHYFDSKEHLLFLIHQDSMERNLKPLILKAQQEPDPYKRLISFMQEFITVQTRDLSVQMLVHEAKRLEPQHYKQIQQAWRDVYRLLRDTLEELKDQGLAQHELNATFGAFAAIGMCVWTPYWYDSSRPESLAEVIDTLTGIFLGGVRFGSQETPGIE